MKIKPFPLYLAADADASAAVLDAPETKEPVTAPGQTPLSEAYNKALKGQQAEAKVDATPDKAAEEAKSEAEKKAKEAAKKSPLDAVLDKPKPDDVKKVDEEIPLNAPAKTLREAYERQKAEAATQKAEVAKWKSEAEKAKNDPEVTGRVTSLQAELDKIKKENAELRDSVTALNVDYDPEVRAKYHDGKLSLIDKTVKSVEQFGGDQKAFAEAMEMPAGKARSMAIRDALENVDEMDKPAIYNKLAKISELEEEHAELLKNSQQSYAELSKKQQERLRQQQEQGESVKRDIFSKAIKALPETNPLLRIVPDTVEGHEAWNGDIKAAHDLALKLLSPEATMEEISAAAVKGARYDYVESLLLEERTKSQAEIAQLKEELAKYQSSEPGFDGRHKASKTDQLDKTPAQIWREEMDKKKERNV